MYVYINKDLLLASLCGTEPRALYIANIPPWGYIHRPAFPFSFESLSLVKLPRWALTLQSPSPLVAEITGPDHQTQLLQA